MIRPFLNTSVDLVRCHTVFVVSVNSVNVNGETSYGAVFSFSFAQQFPSSAELKMCFSFRTKCTIKHFKKGPNIQIRFVPALVVSILQSSSKCDCENTFTFFPLEEIKRGGVVLFSSQSPSCLQDGKYSKMEHLSSSHFEDEKHSVFFVMCDSTQQLGGLRSCCPAICCQSLTLLSLPFQFQDTQQC